MTGLNKTNQKVVCENCLNCSEFWGKKVCWACIIKDPFERIDCKLAYETICKGNYFLNKKEEVIFLRCRK